MLIDQVLSKIENRRVDSCYLIIDQTQFFSDHVLSALKNFFLGKPTVDNFSIFYPDQLQFNELLEDLKTVSIFSLRRLLVFKETERLSKDQTGSLLEELKQSVKDRCLVFVANKNPVQDFFQYFKKTNQLLEFKKPYDSSMSYWVNWIVKRQKKAIDPEAVTLLIEKAGMDLRYLEMEIEKLCLFIGEKNRIESGDVAMLLYSARSHSIFELMTAIGCKKKMEALRILERMMEEGESEVFIYAMLLKHLRNLWKAVEWKSMKSDAEIQRSLGIHPVFWDGFRRQRDLSINSPFESYWKAAFSVDRSLKTSNINKRALLSRFVYAIT